MWKKLTFLSGIDKWVYKILEICQLSVTYFDICDIERAGREKEKVWKVAAVRVARFRWWFEDHCQITLQFENFKYFIEINENKHFKEVFVKTSLDYVSPLATLDIVGKVMSSKAQNEKKWEKGKRDSGLANVGWSLHISKQNPKNLFKLIKRGDRLEKINWQRKDRKSHSLKPESSFNGMELPPCGENLIKTKTLWKAFYYCLLSSFSMLNGKTITRYATLFS